MGGYNNKLAYVNLTARTVSWRELTREECRTWIGGSGLGAKLLLAESRPDVDPLGPDNPLIFTTGPMTGSFIPGAGRHQVVTKSPLTGIYGEADAGGKWGTVLKASGYDGIIILGQTTRPIYLHIHDGIVEIFDATTLWGLDIYDTDAALKEIHGPDAVVAAIGPAGEQQVLMATIVTEGRKAHTAGRGGLGAVMGAKGLKAIVVAGDRPVPVHDRQRLERSIAAVAATIEKRTAALQAYGTAGGITGFERIGDMPVKNWSQGTWPAVEKISGQTMSATMKTGRSKCHNCPVGCRRIVRNKSRYGSVDGAGPEYETLGMFGGACLIDDLEAITQANELCNRYGIDTISTGAAIAFLMDLYERGLVDVDDLHGPLLHRPRLRLHLARVIEGHGDLAIAEGRVESDRTADAHEHSGGGLEAQARREDVGDGEGHLGLQLAARDQHVPSRGAVAELRDGDDIPVPRRSGGLGGLCGGRLLGLGRRHGLVNRGRALGQDHSLGEVGGGDLGAPDAS